MAASGWGTNRPLEELLFEEGYRFEFYQAVRLIERLHERFASDEEKCVSAAEGSEPNKEAVRFKSNADFNFPAGEIREIRKAASEHPSEMTVNFMGLAGHLGPLPAPYTELIRDRVRERDTALRDFLDIFNHRLISLMYRARKVYRIGFDLHSPEKSRFAGYLFSLMGLGTKGLRGRMKVRDRALLSYAELMAQQPRSMAGLEAILSGYFNVRVKGNQLCGQWYDIDEDQLSRIGSSGQNRGLGIDMVIGTRIWDQQGKFEIEIGPITYEQLYDFLPNVGTAYEALCELTRFYVNGEFEFDFLLIVEKGEDIEPRLGRPKGPILGRTSWLRRVKDDAEYERVRLSGRSG